MVKNDNKDYDTENYHKEIIALENIEITETTKKQICSESNDKEILQNIENINQFISINCKHIRQDNSSLKLNEFIKKVNSNNKDIICNKTIISNNNQDGNGEFKLIIKQDDYNLLYSLYNVICHRVPRTHKKKKTFKKYYMDTQGNVKLFFYGYEFIEWIIKSKRNSIDRMEAIKLAQAMLLLFIISHIKLLDQEYQLQNKLISFKKMLFRDDRTCYSISLPINIENYYLYNQYLNKMYRRSKTPMPNPTKLILIIFSIPLCKSTNCCNDPLSGDGNGKCKNILCYKKNNIDPGTAKDITTSTFLPTIPELKISNITNNSEDDNQSVNFESVDEQPLHMNILSPSFGFSSTQTFPLRNKVSFFNRFPNILSPSNSNSKERIATPPPSPSTPSKIKIPINNSTSSTTLRNNSPNSANIRLNILKSKHSNSVPNFNNLGDKDEINGKRGLNDDLHNLYENEEYVNSHYSNDEAFDLSVFSWTRYVPLLIFLVVLSTSALALQHRYLSDIFNYPSLIYKIISGIAAFLWITAFVVVLYGSFTNLNYTISNIKFGLNVTIYGSVAMSLLQIADLSIALSRTLGKVIFWFAVVIQFFSISMLYYQVFTRLKNKKPVSISPTYLFSGAAFIIMATPGYHLGYTAFSWVVFGYGFVYCLIVQVILLTSYIRSARIGKYLPFDQLPTQNILIGFAALGFSSIVTIESRLTVFARYIYLLMFLNFFTAVALWFVIILHSDPNLNVKFSLGWYGFGFPIISMATCSLYYYNYTPYKSAKILSIIMVAMSNACYAILIGMTLYYGLNRNLFTISGFTKTSQLSPKFNSTKRLKSSHRHIDNNNNRNDENYCATIVDNNTNNNKEDDSDITIY